MPPWPHVEAGIPVGGSDPVDLVAVTFSTPLSPPCHPAARVVGSVARVWCPVCGREFQADDPVLTPIGDLSVTGGAMSTGERRRLLADLAEHLRPAGLLARLSGGSVPVLFVDDPRYPPTRRVVTLREDAGEWSYWWDTTARIAPVCQVGDAASILAYAMSRTVGITPIGDGDTSAEVPVPHVNSDPGPAPSGGRLGWGGR
jgi:hypothetical protein